MKKICKKILAGFSILIVLVIIQIIAIHNLQSNLYDNTLQLKEVELPLELIAQSVIGYDAILTGEAHYSLLYAINGEYKSITEHKARYDKVGLEFDGLLKRDALILLKQSKRAPEQREQVLSYLSEIDKFNIALVDLETKAFEAIEKNDIETANSLLTGKEYRENKLAFYQNYLGWKELEHDVSKLVTNKILKNSQTIIYLTLGISTGILVMIILTILLLTSFIKTKEKELDLREKAELGYKKLFEDTSDAIFIADAETRQLIDCNKSAEKLVGRSKKEIISMKADELHPKDMVKVTMEGFKKHMEGKIKFLDTWVLTKDKKRIPVRITSSVVLLDGRLTNQGIFLTREEIKIQPIEVKYRTILFIVLFMAVLTAPSLVSAMSITIGIPEKYSEVKAGEKIYFETEVKWPENVGRKDLRIEYSIKNKDGIEIAYLKVLKAIETQASFMDSISIPESIPPGMYKISAVFSDYKELNQEVIVSFNVDKAGNNVEKYLLIIMGILGIIVLLVFVEMAVLMKRKLKN